MSTTHGRMISDAAASAYMVRQWLAHDVERAAICIWWGLYSPADALEEVQGLGRLLDIRVRRLDCSTDAVAREMLVEAYRRQGDLHHATVEAIKTAVLASLRAGDDRATVARVAASAAKGRRLPPPPAFVTKALEDAAAEFRAAETWWKKRASAA
jgi:hypothetical protein